MLTYLITLSALIAMVLLIRALFRRSVPSRLIYALWLVVVVRLLLPVSLFHLELPNLPENLLPQTEQSTEAEFSPPLTEQPSLPDAVPQTPQNIPDTAPITPPQSQPAINNTVGQTPSAPPQPDSVSPETPIQWESIAQLAWLAGSALLGIGFLAFGIFFRLELCRDRRLYRKLGRIPVYLSQNAGAPCLVGFFAPAIYLTPAAMDSGSRKLIILHEYTHLRHGDHIWSIVRTAALILFWWNPLVWAAAILSKRDAEFACDEAVATKLDESQRLAYAHTIIDSIPQKRSYAVGLGTAPIKERIRKLTGKPKNRILCAVLAVLLALSAVGCSFIGQNTDTSNPDPAQTDAPAEDPFAAEYPQLAELLTLTVGEIREKYGEMTLEYSEYGPGQPVYSLEKLDGVLAVFSRWDMNTPLTDDMTPYELILTGDYPDRVKGLSVGMRAEDAAEIAVWDEAWAELVNGTASTKSTFGGYTLTAVMADFGVEIELDYVGFWPLWREEYRQAPTGEVVQLRIGKAPALSADLPQGIPTYAQPVSLEYRIDDSREYAAGETLEERLLDDRFYQMLDENKATMQLADVNNDGDLEAVVTWTEIAQTTQRMTINHCSIYDLRDGEVALCAIPLIGSEIGSDYLPEENRFAIYYTEDGSDEIFAGKAAIAGDILYKWNPVVNGFPTSQISPPWITAYNEFLNGKTAAVDKNTNQTIRIDELYNINGEPGITQFALFDVNGDDIPELHTTSLQYDIFSYEDGQVVYWYHETISSMNGPIYPLENGALFARHSSTVNMYHYTTFDAEGNASTLEFINAENDAMDPLYFFDDRDVSKAEWESLTEDYLAASNKPASLVWYDYQTKADPPALVSGEDRAAIVTAFNRLLDDFQNGVYPHVGRYGLEDLSIDGVPSDTRLPERVTESDLEFNYDVPLNNYPISNMIHATLSLENNYTLSAQFYEDSEQVGVWKEWHPHFTDLNGSRNRALENAVLTYDRLTQKLELTDYDMDYFPQTVTGNIIFFPAGNFLRVELRTPSRGSAGFHWNLSDNSIDGSSDIESLVTSDDFRFAGQECLALLLTVRDSHPLLNQSRQRIYDSALSLLSHSDGYATPALDGFGEWYAYEDLGPTNGIQMTVFRFHPQNRKMEWKIGLRESEWRNTYSGSFAIDEDGLFTASLSDDRRGQSTNLTFIVEAFPNLTYGTGAAEYLSITILSCDDSTYQDMVGKPIVFSSHEYIWTNAYQ